METISHVFGQFRGVCASTILLFGTIKGFHAVPVLIYLSLPAGCIITGIHFKVLFKFSGSILTSSQDILHSRKRNIIQQYVVTPFPRDNLRIERKYLETSHEVKVSVGGIYFISNHTILTYSSIIVSLTINFLVA